MMDSSKAYCSWWYELGEVVDNDKINSCYNLPIDSCNKKKSSNTILAKGDSAASYYYWRLQDKYCLTNIK